MTRRILAVSAAAVVVLTTGCGGGPHHSATADLRARHAGVSMFFPTWSRDGKLVAWTQPTGGGTARVWVARANGSAPHPVGRPIEAIGQIAWLPGNELMYWASFSLYRLTLAGTSSPVAPVEGERFVLDARGEHVATGPPGCPFCGGPVRVDDVASGVGRSLGSRSDTSDSPSLSPAGADVAARRYRCGTAESDCARLAGIWVSPTTDEDWRRLTATGNCPIWSPGGHTLLYLGTAGAVRLVPIAGGPSRLLVRTGRCSAAFPPSWSPDSRHVALFQDRPGRLVVVDVATRRVRVIANASIGVVTGFSWSPDSSSLLVTARPVPLACASLLRVDVATGTSKLLRAC